MNDDQLVRQFLKSNIRKPENKGFSQRVMTRLPRRTINLAWITALEGVVLIIGITLLLVRTDLLQVLCNISMHILQCITYMHYVDLTINPLYIVIVLIMLTAWCGNKIKTLI